MSRSFTASRERWEHLIRLDAPVSSSSATRSLLGAMDILDAAVVAMTLLAWRYCSETRKLPEASTTVEGL
ncbi:hypothetical protein [Halolamina sp.]|uniref:hypothetical protein n=1 Tax=Halolamina sp. TaxID=1940283 RepID=UPI0012FD9FEE